MKTATVATVLAPFFRSGSQALENPFRQSYDYCRQAGVGQQDAFPVDRCLYSLPEVFMTDLLQLSLTDRQREIILRGLRFVRSSRLLEFRESAEITEQERQDELREIGQLNELLQIRRQRTPSSSPA